MYQNKYVIEIIIFTTYALFAFSWVAGAFMSKDIMAFYSIKTYAAATWTTNAITVAKIVGNLFAAWVLVKLGIKRAFLASSALVVAGGLGIFAGQYSLYVFSRLVLGMGGALIIVYFNPIVVRYFEAGERPLINGVNAAAFNTGNLFALLLTGSLLAKLGTWQNVILAISACSLAVLVLAAFFLEDFPLNKAVVTGDVVQEYTMRDGFKDPVNWWLPFTYSGILFFYIAVFSLFPQVPDFAVDASKLSAIFIAAGMAGTVAGIVMTRRFPRRIPLIRYSGLATTACAALMVSTANPVIAYAAACSAGFLLFLPMTALFTLAQELPGMTPKRVTVIFGMFWSITYAIATVLMLIAGLMADYTQDVIAAVVFSIICSSTFFIGSFMLPETGKARREPETQSDTAETEKEK